MTIAVCTFILVVAAGGIFAYNKFSGKPKEIQTVYKNDVKTIEPDKIVLFSDFGARDFTCTGLTYDSVDEAFWIGDYGALSVNETPEPRLIEVDKNLNAIIRILPISDVIEKGCNLQGVAYDIQEDCLWLAVGKNIFAVNKEGMIIHSIDMEKYAGSLSNGIAYDKDDDSIWVLCASNYLLNYSKNGTLLAELPFNYADQDHLCIMDGYLYITVGADYNGRNNFICKVSSQDGSITTLYRTYGAESLEGICIHDGHVMIVNDGAYHNDPIGHSYITVYSENDLK